MWAHNWNSSKPIGWIWNDPHHWVNTHSRETRRICNQTQPRKKKKSTVKFAKVAPKIFICSRKKVESAHKISVLVLMWVSFGVAFCDLRFHSGVSMWHLQINAWDASVSCVCLCCTCSPTSLLLLSCVSVLNTLHLFKVLSSFLLHSCSPPSLPPPPLA